MSQPRDLVVLGGGDHARMVIEAAQSRPDLWRVAGFIDPSPCPETTERYGVRRVAESEEGLPHGAPFDHCAYVLGVGRFAHVSLSAAYRQEIVRRLARRTGAGRPWSTRRPSSRPRPCLDAGWWSFPARW